ncbi:urease accessory protein UreD [Aquabacterium sp.]|uniref:urease accessory protein UreD n=1 Tax=Aquabacterium sp. TaxID=1872578 RepID=UPI003783D6EE
MGWQGHLDLHYRRDGERTIALDRHHGPLRVLQRLYPEGPAVCHHVLVHPPGGIVGGDELRIDVRLDPGTQALITTPGATRFYRSAGDLALQQATLQLAEGARLEWLPLETIAYRGCEAENRVRCELAPGAQMIGWDLLALGLPAAGQAFDHGRFQQQLALPGVWLERGRIDGQDTLLLDSPLGLAGHRVLGSLWLAGGAALGRVLAEALVDAARALIDAHPLAAQAGVTPLHERAVVLRVLADRVEPAMQLLQSVWAAWRPLAWGQAPVPPRVWRT